MYDFNAFMQAQTPAYGSVASNDQTLLVGVKQQIEVKSQREDAGSSDRGYKVKKATDEWDKWVLCC